MKLHIQNFGPIEEAHLDLSKDLIILTGENNTGKTYVANVVAALFEFDNPASTIIDNLEISFDQDFEVDLEDIIENSFKNYPIWTNAAEVIIADYLHIEEQDHTNANIKFEYTSEYLNKCKKLLFSSQFEKYYQGNGDQTMSLYKDKESFLMKVRFLKRKSIEKVKDNEHTFYFFISNVFANYLKYKTFFIPAERQGINLFSKELFLIKNQAFDKLLSNGRRQEMLNFFSTRFNRYPKSIQDALEFVQNLDYHRTQKSPFAYLADELESSFLQGKLGINEQGDIQFQPDNSKESLEVHLASSTVKSLSWLSIYLRHTAQKGDFIIIDEPELNLHPDNQVKIARFLSRLINEGFKLMISTHSDYIIRELNTLIMLDSGYKKEKNETVMLMNRYSYQKDELLSKDRVGVYLFRQGEAVKQVEIKEEGFQIETIDRTVEKLNESSQNIYFELF